MGHPRTPWAALLALALPLAACTPAAPSPMAAPTPTVATTDATTRQARPTGGPTSSPAVTPSTAPAPTTAPGAQPVAPPALAAELVRVAWGDSGYPTPFRMSSSGPGGPVLISMLYDTLTWKDERGMIPWLAERWTVGDDGQTYTFTLVDAARWHDGQPLTAADVAFSFAAYAKTPFPWMSTDVVERAEATGPREVAIRLKRPYAAFLEDIAGVVPIVPRHVWEKVADPKTYGGPDASVGSGPFRLAEYRPTEGAYRMTANPDYFRGRVVVKELQQLNVPADTRVQLHRQGQLELSNTADATATDLFQGDPRLAVHESDPLSIVRLAVNTQRAPLDRKEVRQAIMYAIDRAALAAAVTKGPPIVGNAGVVPPTSPWLNPSVRQYPYDPARARELLGGSTYTIELLSSTGYREPELMQPMLEAVGIKLAIKPVDNATRVALLREGNFQLAELQHIGVGGDPDYLRRWYAGEEANDFAQGSIFKHAEFERLAAQSATLTDPANRRDVLGRMQAILAEELPTLVLYHRPFYWIYDRNRFAPVKTSGGLLNGIPFPNNKLAFVER